MKYEDPICDEIAYLENQKEYYRKHIDDLHFGILAEGQIHFIRNDIRKLEETIAEAKESYSVADFSRARKKIVEGQRNDNILKRKFGLLDPTKVLYDKLCGVDKSLAQLDILAGRLYSYSEDAYVIEQIRSDINATRNKTDEAWGFFRNGNYSTANELVDQIKSQILDIKARIDLISIVTPPGAPS